MRVDNARFSEILHEIGNLVALWRDDRYREVEPTAIQQMKALKSVARSARNLADALAAWRQPKSMHMTEPEELLCAVYPYDEHFVEAARQRAKPTENEGTWDPLAGYESDLPWSLEGLYESFERFYADQDVGKHAFNSADDAFAHLCGLIPVLARAAESRCRELTQHTAKRKANAKNLRTATPSANERLLHRLAPLYEEMFKPLGRSSREAPREVDADEARQLPVGPGVRFFLFIFGRLLGDEAPEKNTIATWIQRRPREDGRDSG